MKTHLKSILIAAAGLALSSLGASAGSLTFQNVTFSLTDEGGGLLQLEITNALNANGNWAGIQYLEAFSLVPSGGTITGASVTNVSGWTEVAGGLSNGVSSAGCDTHGAGVCFFSSAVNPPSPPTLPSNPFALTNDVVLDVQFTGSNIAFTPTTHLKVDFWTSPSTNCSDPPPSSWNCNSTGDLLSQDISVGSVGVPGPIVGAGLPGLIAACGGLLALGRRRRLKQLA